MPSLILRLEQLSQVAAATEPVVGPAAEPATESSAAPAPTAAQPAGPPPTGVQLQATLRPEATGQPSTSTSPSASTTTTTARRVVDVAAPERLLTATPLSRWSAAVAAAHDACFVLDLDGTVISISVAGVELLGCGDAAIIGRHVLDVVNLVDLETGALHPAYAPRITPLVVLDGPGLARSIMRVRHQDNAIVTLDSSSAPIHDVTGHLLGSVTFLAPIPAR